MDMANEIVNWISGHSIECFAVFCLVVAWALRIRYELRKLKELEYRKSAYLRDLRNACKKAYQKED